MQVQKVLVLLTFAAFAVTAQTTNLSKEKIIARYLADHRGNTDIINEQLQSVIEKTSKVAVTTFQTMITVVNSKEQEISNELLKKSKNIMTAIMTAKTTEMDKAKEEGNPENAEAIASCVKNEQTKYEADLKKDLADTQNCCKETLKSAITAIKYASSNFSTKSYAGPRRVSMERNWRQCTVRLNRECAEKVFDIHMKRITDTNAAFTEATATCTRVVTAHEEDTMQCVKNYTAQVEERKKSHAEVLKKCSTNPEGGI